MKHRCGNNSLAVQARIASDIANRRWRTARGVDSGGCAHRHPSKFFDQGKPLSIRIMSLVWDSGLYEGSTLVTLLALADWADEEGICYPSVPTLARKSRQSERNLQRCLSQLADEVSIWRKFRKNERTLYRINVRKFATLAGGDRLSPPDKLSPVTNPAKVVTPASPNTSLKPTISKNLFGNSLRSSPANGKSGEPKPIDPRFQPVVKACKQCWPDGVLFDMGPEDGAAINRMLARRHKWTAEELAECIVFRFLSENINPGESIKAWIAAVCDYSTGPRDKFDVPKPDFEYWRKHAKKLLYGEAPEQIPLRPVLTECWHCSAKYDAAIRSSLPESEQGFCSDRCSAEHKLWRKESADLGIDMDSLRRKKRSERLAGAAS